MSTTNATEALLEIVTDNVDKANAIAVEAKNALGNSAKQIKEYREDSETSDETIKKYQTDTAKIYAKLEELTVKVNDYIKTEKMKSVSWTDEVTEAKRKEHKEYKSAATEAFKAVANMNKILGLPEPEMPELLTFSGSTAKGGTGTGTRRLRFDRVEVNGEVVKNLSAVAQKIKSASGATVSAKDLQKAVFETANSDDMDVIASLGDVTFQWTETDKDKVVHTFDVTVFKSADTDSTEEDTDDENGEDEESADSAE